MKALQVSLFLLSSGVNSLLVLSQVLSSVLKLSFLVFDLVLEVLNLDVIQHRSMFQLLFFSLLLNVDVRFEVLDALLDLIKGNLLDKDLLRHGNRRKSLGLQPSILILNTETGKSSVNTNREKLAVVVVEAHALDLLRVSLNFDHFLH